MLSDCAEDTACFPCTQELYACSEVQDSSVCITTGDGLDGCGSIPCMAVLVFTSTQPPIQPVPGTISPGVKRQGRIADHSPPSSANVKNGSAMRLHGTVLNQLRAGTALPFLVLFQLLMGVLILETSCPT
jgi:hypothetical protein